MNFTWFRSWLHARGAIHGVAKETVTALKSKQEIKNSNNIIKMSTHGIFSPTQPATTCPEWIPMRTWKSSPGRWRISNFDARFKTVRANDAIWLAWSEFLIGSPLTTCEDSIRNVIKMIQRCGITEKCMSRQCLTYHVSIWRQTKLVFVCIVHESTNSPPIVSTL